MLKNSFSDEEKNKIYNELITFFNEERGETIGVIQAEKFFDFFLEHIGNNLYNKGVDDSKKKIFSNLEELDFHLEELKK